MQSDLRDDINKVFEDLKVNDVKISEIKVIIKIFFATFFYTINDV